MSRGIHSDQDGRPIRRQRLRYYLFYRYKLGPHGNFEWRRGWQVVWQYKFFETGWTPKRGFFVKKSYWDIAYWA